MTIILFLLIKVIYSNSVNFKSKILPFYYQLKKFDDTDDNDELRIKDDEAYFDVKKDKEDIKKNNNEQQTIKIVDNDKNLMNEHLNNYKDWFIKTNRECLGKTKEVRNLKLEDFKNDSEIEHLEKYDNTDISFVIVCII